MKKLFKSIAVVAVVLISSGVFAQAKKAASAPLNENSLYGKFQERIKQNFLFIWNDSYDMCR
jgi:hypothetical protein